MFLNNRGLLTNVPQTMSIGSAVHAPMPWETLAVFFEGPYEQVELVACQLNSARLVMAIPETVAPKPAEDFVRCEVSLLAHIFSKPDRHFSIIEVRSDFGDWQPIRGMSFS